MKKTFKSEGVDYKLSTEWDDKQNAIKINLDIKARDWKKAKNLDIVLIENDFPFIVTSSLFFGYEEYGIYEGRTEIDYNEVNLFVNVSSLDGKNLYSRKLNNPFYENLTFFIKPY